MNLIQSLLGRESRDRGDTVRPGDAYLIPLQPGKQAIATIFGLGVPLWNPRLQVMLVGVYNCLVDAAPPSDFLDMLPHRYWCISWFVKQGKWSLIRRGSQETSGKTSTAHSVWGTHELFLDELRQRLGLERQTYKGAEFTFSTHCRVCGAKLYRGFARCPKCRDIREEFHGLEQFVADEVGICQLSGATTDVRDSDGLYYWAPYFIDRVRTRLADPGFSPDAGRV
jgi:hypothetical protein